MPDTTDAILSGAGGTALGPVTELSVEEQQRGRQAAANYAARHDLGTDGLRELLAALGLLPDQQP
ncbi:hypothetical protein [Actinosynnema mirum]|uniref:Uncharacterized protein n=1 Tax=Actinosynnema mirum (strain ATCC 29888 / DSM 43827 / JCM 3225 / NBRC 14064 / NCIMB 13271 / NRRL B-12336 / IMRU 3971 / 101) TaxID=446462 RepID=C6WBA3_ACTMD|nr:hypothetical protein [Actinosynnema mirum]ACU39394.1 hypothetical protein Amir_5576 [Actinosynnema mirum DSM 43827]